MTRFHSDSDAITPGRAVRWCAPALGVLLLAGAAGAGADAAPDPTLSWKQLPPLPDAQGVAAPFAGVSAGSLLVAGGANFPNGFPWQGGRKVWHDQIWQLDPSADRWRVAGALPRSLAYGVSISLPGGVLCIGGSDQDRHWPEVFELRSATDQVTSLTTRLLAPLPIPLANAAGALVGDTVYVVGGATQPGEDSASRRVFTLAVSNSLNLGREAWKEIEPLPGAPRILSIAASFGGSLYVIGGVALAKHADAPRASRVYLRDVWRYRPGQGWKRLADAPRPIAGAPSPAPVRAGEILMLGGDDGSLVNFRPLDRHPGWPRVGLAYDVARDRWHSLSGALPAPRATVPCVEWQGRVVVPSGEVRPGVRSPEVWSIPAP